MNSAKEHHQHRSDTNFKQSNKPHKTGRHVSKSSLKKKAKGKIEQERTSVKEIGKGMNRQDKRNKSKQAISKQRDNVLMARRTGKDKIPRTTAVISLGAEPCSDQTWKLLLESCELPTEQMGPVTTSVQAWKQRVTLLKPPRDVSSVLDACKVADVLLLVVPPSGVDSLGQLLISLIKGQGVPTVIGVIFGNESVPQKNRLDVKKEHTKLLEMQFPDISKVITLDNVQDASQVLRFVCNSKIRDVHWREVRPYMLSDKVQFTPNTDNPKKGVLSVSGFLRGADLNVNNLVHIPGVGDFQLKQVDKPADPYLPQRVKKLEGMETDTSSTAEEIQVLAVPQPDLQESLQAENVPDTFASEQTWPTEEELKEADDRMEALNGKKVKRMVPKGTSAYQAAWLLEDSDEESQDEEEDDQEDMNENVDINHTSEPAPKPVAEEQPEEEEELEEFEELKEDDAQEDHDADLMEQEMLKKQRSKEDMEFPDEVDTPLDKPARLRFQKYRGLKSFRTSPWDTKENLPFEYAKIYQFQSFNRAKKRVLSDTSATVSSGQYITLQILNVPQSVLDRPNDTPLVIGGLLKYENKVSVLHFTVSKHPTYSEPIQSKEQLVILCGWRRYNARPIFSEHNANCDKHKYENFLHPGYASMASVYAPITFPPMPVIMMKENQGRLSIAATGSLHSVNADRIILKKIILTGYPFKIFKRHAVVRQMFYNAGDINWFKPVEVYTKHGKVGHIMEPLGTHGQMKVQFDSQLLQNDTVCMSLYKRVYPKWDAWWTSTTTSTESIPQSVPEEMKQ